MGLINQQVLNTGTEFTQAIFHYDFKSLIRFSLQRSNQVIWDSKDSSNKFIKN